MENANAFISGNPEQSRTLVVVFLRGGADGLNMVAPIEDDQYHSARPTIGVSKSNAVSLDGFYGLHPKLAPLQKLYNDGELAIVHCAGSEDTTHSHFEAQDFMEHGGFTAGGWLGRFLRAKVENARSPLSAIAVGKALPESLRGAPAAIVMEDFDSFSFGDKSVAYMETLKMLYANEQDFLGTAGVDTISAMGRIQELRDQDYHPSHGAKYDNDNFSTGLRHIAQLIKARVGLEAVSLDLDGWDSHFTQGTLMEPLMDRLARGLAAFNADLGTFRASTTVVVMTEFGRRVYENASFGTDHGSGSVMFVLGGGVRGGKIYCDWPGLAEPSLLGPGDVPVLHNYRNVLAPVLQRHGCNGAIASVFPDFQLDPLPIYA
jgi:uncharacterized protein (DUF1501 family)